MIEVIVFAETALRVESIENHEPFITDMLQGLMNEIVTEEIISISNPQKNAMNHTIESNVLAKYILNIAEEDQSKNVEDYVDDIIPFLKRHLPKCNRVNSTKIIQMKRIRPS